MTASGSIGSFTSAYSRIESLDWTHSGANTRGGTHGVHPYPAKFIPQIPGALIRELHPGDDSAVLDPFCGSGTTLVEASLAGVPAVGIDLHPLACLISKVKVTPLHGSLLEAAASAVRNGNSSGAQIPLIPALDHWFDPAIQQALADLRGAIDLESDVDVRDALKVALSSIIVKVSRQESDTRYAAIDKNTDPKAVATLFLQSAAKIEKGLAATFGPLLARPRVRVLNRDILDLRPAEIEERVSLVVTSPPYPNAYEYWLYHKYRMYWLGMDPIRVREREIGARPHFFKKSPHTAAHFGAQMARVMESLAAIVVPGGHVCVQVGDSMIKGELIDNAAMIRQAAAAVGFAEAVSLRRTIPRARKAFNPSNARIQEESIVIFRRED